MNRQSLVNVLRQYGVPFETWGQGATKTFEHLLEELESGEAKLGTLEGHLVWSAQVVSLNVWYQSESRGLLKLKEDRQEFTGGRVRKRESLTSVGEKIKPGESSLEAAGRAMREELGIISEVEFLNHRQLLHKPQPTQTYPGLWSTYTLETFDVYLTDDQFKSHGYIEIQKDKTSYFVWTEVVE